MVRRLVNGDLERTWNGLIVARFEAFPWRGMKKTARNLRIFGQNSSQTPTEHKRELLCSVEKERNGMGYEGLYWIHRSQYKEHQEAIVNTVMKNWEYLFTSCSTISF